jgi:hypothetical protein
MQSSNKADNGGLNFVFESGSSGRENKKYVRSHAAKVGWSQRSRKQAPAANKDDVVATTKDATPRKRRKTTHQDPQVGHAEQHQQQQSSICSPPPTQHSVNQPVHSQAEAGPEASRGPALQASTQLPPQQHVLNQDGHSTVHSAPQAPTSAIQAPPHNYAPSSSSSPPRYFHRPGQPASVRAQDVTATSPIPIVTGAPPTYPLAQGVPHWHTRPEPVQHDFVAQHSVVPLFRPAASPGPMYPPQVMSGADVLRPVPPTSSPMPSPRLPPIANVHTSGPSLVGANWRQYDNMPVVNPAVSQPSTPAPGTPIRHDEKTEASTSSRRPASPKKRSTPAFLELILNEDYPMWKNVDSGNDSFNVFPVRWQPFYGRLLHNCECSRPSMTRRTLELTFANRPLQHARPTRRNPHRLDSRPEASIQPDATTPRRLRALSLLLASRHRRNHDATWSHIPNYTTMATNTHSRMSQSSLFGSQTRIRRRHNLDLEHGSSLRVL